MCKGGADMRLGYTEKAIELLKASAEQVNIARVLDGGDYVSIHSHRMDGGKMKAAIDIYRFENGEVTEHLTNSQTMPDAPNPSGHTMMDGFVEAVDFEKSAENKALVEKLLDAMLNGRANELPAFFDGDNYINHNPAAYDGLSGFAKGMKERAEKGIITKYDRVALVFGAGNFVQTVMEGALSGVPTMFFDIFRVENGKIAEHWDVIAPKE